MRRLILGIALLSAATLCWAQAYDPKIAYTSFQGNADNIYVANANGTNPVSVYRLSKARIDAIDMAPINPAMPTIRRIAFSQSGVLKILSYEVLPGGIRTIGVATLDSFGAPYQGADEPDFSPDGSKILYARRINDPVHGSGTLSEIRLVASSGSPSPKVLYTATQAGSRYIRQPRWLGASEFAFLRGGDLSYSTDIQLASLDANDDLAGPPSALFTSADPCFSWDGLYRGFEDFDVARTRATLLLSVSGPGNYRTFVEYNLLDDTCVHHFSDNGWRGHFSSGDAHIVYLHQKPGVYNASDYVQRFDTISRNTVKFTGKGLFGYADTQP